MCVAKFRPDTTLRSFQRLIIGGYLDKSEKYNTTGPCYKAINIIRKIRYRNSDYFTRTRLIDLINAEILNILYIYPPVSSFRALIRFHHSPRKFRLYISERMI